MIEDALLKYLGIYPEVIERFDELVEDVCREYDIDSDAEVWPHVTEHFEDEFCKRPTNWLIWTMFHSLETALVDSGKLDEGRIDWYVEGYCSDFIIDGETVRTKPEVRAAA